MPGCCVPLCKNRSGGSGQRRYSFHRFPACQEKRKLWLNLIRRDNFTPTANTRVCSWHFPDGFEAGPTRFHWNVSESTYADPMPLPSHFTKKKLRMDADQDGEQDGVTQFQSNTKTQGRDVGPADSYIVDHHKKRDSKEKKEKNQSNTEEDCEKAHPTQELMNSHQGQCAKAEGGDVKKGETFVILPLSEEDFTRRITKRKEENARLKEDIERLKEKLKSQRKRKADAL
eukprot:XP_011677487.1 PREDICTED: THAP domain-containing protein 4-like [Strongylocentrotus purpuratus]